MFVSVRTLHATSLRIQTFNFKKIMQEWIETAQELRREIPTPKIG